MNEELAGIVSALKAASADPRIWRTVPGKKDPKPYIPWQTVAGILERHASGWSTCTTRCELQDSKAIVTVALCIAGISREATAATSLIEIDRYGKPYEVDAYEIAERSAFKRAATLFGVGRQVPDSVAA